MSRDNTIRCWDVATGALKWTIGFHDDLYRALAIAFSPDSRMLLLATCGNPMLEMDTKRGEKEEIDHDFEWMAYTRCDDYWITYVKLSPDSGTPKISHGNHMVQLHRVSLSNENYDWISAFAFSSDCKMLASGWQKGSIQLWDATTGICRQTIQGHDRRINNIAVSPDGSKIASKSDQSIRLWDAATGALLEEIDWPFGLGGSIAFCQGSKKLLCRNILCDLTTKTIVQTSMSEFVSVTATSPGNTILAFAEVDIKLWNATTGIQEKNESDPFPDAPRKFAISLDGTTVACAKSNIVQIWNTATGECWRTIEDNWPDIVPWQGVTTLHIVGADYFEYTASAFSANGKILALGSRHYNTVVLTAKSLCQIQVWDTVAGKCTYRKTVRGESDSVSAIAISPDGNKLAAEFVCGTKMLLDITTGRCLWKTRTEYADSNGPECFAFFPDSSTLAWARYKQLSAETCEIDLRDTATGHHRQTLEVDIPDPTTCKSIMFSPDGRYLYIKNQCKVRLFPEDEKISIPTCVPVTGGWITKDGRCLLWIPEEYRTHCAFMCGNTVVLGHESGVTFIWLDL